MSKEMPKLTSRGYELAKKLFDIYYPKTKPSTENDKIQPRSRIIGSTDYSKFDKIAIEIEREEILSKKKILNMTNPNDIKIQRQMFEGSSKPRIEMCTIFKNEGDENLINKKYIEAQNSYEKALSNLFYNFDDKEEQKKIEKLKCSINLNLSMVLMKLKNYKDAIGYLIEAKRLQPDNLKTLYRMAYCYYCVGDYDKARNIVNDVIKNKNNNSEEFKNLLDEINNKELSDNKKRGKMLKGV